MLVKSFPAPSKPHPPFNPPPSLSLVTAYVSIMHLASPRIFFAVRRVSVWEFFRMSWEPPPFLGVILTIPFLVLRERRLAAASILALGLMLPFNYDARIVVSLCWLLLVMLLTWRSIDFNELLRMLSASTLFLTLVIIIHLVSYPFQPVENRILARATITGLQKSIAELQAGLSSAQSRISSLEKQLAETESKVSEAESRAQFTTILGLLLGLLIGLILGYLLFKRRSKSSFPLPPE
jgi:tetrahydromethanopterin S-methyltransferase subunit G